MYGILLTLLPSRKSHYHKYTWHAFQVANLLLLASKEEFLLASNTKITDFLSNKHCSV